MTEPSGQKHCGVAGIYGDVFSKVGDAVTTMEAFPQPPTQQLDRHMEIGDGSHSVESEVKQAYEENNKLIPSSSAPCMCMMTRPPATPWLRKIGVTSGGAAWRGAPT